MAFRVPSQAPRRQTSYSTSTSQQASRLEIPSANAQLLEDESTQWVLFSPSQALSSTLTGTASTDRTPTAGLSRLSDFGSFGVATQSADDNGNENEDDEGIDEDGTELDSLDEGLHAFREPSVDPTNANRWDAGPPAMLPAHDGLGSFQASSQPVLEQLWQHEQYNPARRTDGRPRRQSSVQRQLDSLAEHEEARLERERWLRIEQWRMEQSRVVLQEIERENLRRRRDNPAGAVTESSVPRTVTTESPDGTQEMPADKARQPSSERGDGESELDESFWQRITRKVIRDLMGIDDTMLSVLFGESLPLEVIGEGESLTGVLSEETNRREASPLLNMDAVLQTELDSAPHEQQHPQWQTRLLQRISRELGILVHQLCEHPGAFTTYLQMSKSISNEYAGMLVVPPRGESSVSRSMHSTSAAVEPASLINSANTSASIASPRFSPTLRDPSSREHAAHWGIEEDDDSSRADADLTQARIQQEQEYWERELDIKMVFRYLRNRFKGSKTTTANTISSTDNANNHPTPSPLQDSSRRAAIIRQYHPLVARAHSRSQAQAQLRRQLHNHHNHHNHHHHPHQSAAASPILRHHNHHHQPNHICRPGSSCASQSAKRSALSSKRTLTGSSRNYWDIGGSVDSSSAVASVGPGWDV
ncbi:hypothetical protein ASPZODRAFT_148075 [Penicilliopsis zonata CBS 506.65]|uniref:Uncharacterized protein n=1 Tax=Penicilliopsis zonata CBS 506.65 TaxID=1073090 RepID=A0A1L9STY8_9EURO|nr:hypothetical protein ASPZODRAFT_148075 [Penicilliopsis zonata CBS 506.65]OJJ50584.1 hypothetical protein ASPZODRAFT_148075 [Penicilliopsis zonata CBS 506.65]